MERPRGPDVQMTVEIPNAWLEQGATLTVELPRNLACAACGGGGCDACERSGAVSLRGRKDAPEIVEVTLPSGGADAPADVARLVVLRIPDRGGLPPPAEIALPRGNLLLSVRGGSGDPPPGVKRLARPSIPAPAPVEIVSVHPAPRDPSARPAAQRPPLLVLAAVAITVGLVVYFLLRR